MLFLCMGQRCFPYPVPSSRALRLASSLLITNSATVNYFVKLLPVDLTKAVVTAFSVKMQIRVRNGHTEHFNLWNGVIHETLAEFVVGETFDFQVRLLALFGELSSFGPNIIKAGHQKRLMASCNICF